MSTLQLRTPVQEDPIEGWEAANRQLDLRFMDAMTRKDVQGVMHVFSTVPI